MAKLTHCHGLIRIHTKHAVTVGRRLSTFTSLIRGGLELLPGDNLLPSPSCRARVLTIDRLTQKMHQRRTPFLCERTEHLVLLALLRGCQP